MAQKPHSEHRRRYAWCARCEFESLSPDEQDRRIQARRDAAHARWEAAHPDRAVIRDRLLTDWQSDSDGVATECDRCRTRVDLLPIVDYRRQSITGWRCRRCFSNARNEVLFARLATRLSIPPAALQSLFDGPKAD